MRVLIIGNSVFTPDSFRDCINGKVEVAGILSTFSTGFASDVAAAGSVDMVIAHSLLPGNINSVALLKNIKAKNPLCHTVLVIEYGRDKNAVLGDARGVDTYLASDFYQQVAALVDKLAVEGYHDSREQKPSVAAERDSTSKPEDKRAFSYITIGRKALRVAAKVLFSVMIIVMAVMAFFMVQSRLSGGVPSVAGYQIYVVLSGSMSPAFDTGSVVWLRSIEPEDVQVGDIITFSGRETQKFTTHRVVEIQTEGGLRFITRGDANNVDDPNPVLPRQLVGKVHGSLAYVGYVMGFAQTRQGLLFLVFIPGILIIGYELYNIYRYTIEPDKNKAA